MFDDHFEVIFADTEWAKTVHYRLRYRVYCLERGYEDPQAHPNASERDRYDDAAAHFLVRAVESREWLAGLRLITVPFESLPMIRVCEIYKEELPDFKKGKVAEVSRLCALTPKATLNVSSETNTSWLSMGLIRAARSYALQHNIRYFAFFITDPLARLLRRVGIEFTPVGPVSNYRGERRPYLHDVKLGYREMPFKAPDVSKMFCHRPAYRFASTAMLRRSENKRIETPGLADRVSNVE